MAITSVYWTLTMLILSPWYYIVFKNKQKRYNYRKCPPFCMSKNLVMVNGKLLKKKLSKTKEHILLK